MEGDSIGLDKKNIASISDLCRACVSDTQLSDNNSIKSTPVTCDNHQLQRLDFQHQVDLEESDFEFVMDTLARENINEMVRQIQELGPSFTSSIDSCQQNLQSIVGDGQLDEQLVARLISVMIATPNRGDSGATAPGGWDSIASTGSMPSMNSPSLPWNGSVFVAAIHNLAPSLSWSDVVAHLDHPYFSVPSKQALQLLTQIIVEGVENHSFPINHIYRLWNGNKAGQLSWMIQIVQNPEIFYVLDQQHRPVNCGCLKVMPDEGTRSCAQWKCLDLVEVLFRLSEVSSLATTVYNLLKTPGPMATCPDLLFLGIVQISLAMSQLRVHILKQLVGQLLTNTPSDYPQRNGHILCAKCGGPESVDKDIGDCSRAKTKWSGGTVNLQQFPFVIDLACLASRRDFLKLDKFLEDKLSEHGDLFAQQLCQYIKRRCPGLSSTNNPIPTDTFQLMFTVLQSRANTSSLISSELTQLYQQMRSGSVSAQGSGLAPSSTYRDTPPWPPSATNQSSVAAANQQQPPTMMGFTGPRGLAMKTGVMPALGTSNQPMEFGENLENAVFSDEVQEEANSYFQQIYSPAGRMSVNDFITKLKLFRDSHNQRGKELLMCVLKNLFDEYRFFQEYPDRELRTTAEVYGGIIRENIVMNIHFATAVRKVVEALQSEPMQPCGTLE
uniref:Uncharacterized protein n=1 Tax=Ditylenchus dipsaci TaxID=166011 RepID=A0A915E071_9BILA